MVSIQRIAAQFMEDAYEKQMLEKLQQKPKTLSKAKKIVTLLGGDIGKILSLIDFVFEDANYYDWCRSVRSLPMPMVDLTQEDMDHVYHHLRGIPKFGSHILSLALDMLRVAHHEALATKLEHLIDEEDSKLRTGSDNRSYTSHLEKALSTLKDATTYSKTNVQMSTTHLADMFVELQRAFEAVDRKDISRSLAKVAQDLRSASHRTADEKPVHQIDHGYDQPLAGGTDVMRRLVNQFKYEQGLEPRETNPWIPKT